MSRCQGAGVQGQGEFLHADCDSEHSLSGGWLVPSGLRVIPVTLCELLHSKEMLGVAAGSRRGGGTCGASGFPPSLSNLGVVITTCPDTHAWTGSADASSVLHQIPWRKPVWPRLVACVALLVACVAATSFPPRPPSPLSSLSSKM